jgi:hypothetical protein
MASTEHGMTAGGRLKATLGLAVALVLLAAACDAVTNDYTRDGTSDLVYLDLATGSWMMVGQSTPLWTGTSALAVPGDYNHDLKWEPAELNGTTWTSSALSSPIDYDPAGMPAGPAATPAGATSAPPTLLPVPGDYDGTGKTVPAYYDQVDGTWWIMGHNSPVQFGDPPTAGGTQGYDVPVPADYDGDGKTDIAVFRPTDGSYHYLSSKTGTEVDVAAGSEYDFPVPEDFDGDGKADAAVTDGAFEHWYEPGSSTPFATFSAPFGDLLVPTFRDYDGDGKADAAVWDEAGSPVTTTWLVAGHGTMATLPSTGDRYEDVEAPPWLLVNIVRLTVFHKCLVDPAAYPSGMC